MTLFILDFQPLDLSSPSLMNTRFVSTGTWKVAMHKFGFGFGRSPPGGLTCSMGDFERNNPNSDVAIPNSDLDLALTLTLTLRHLAPRGLPSSLYAL